VANVKRWVPKVNRHAVVMVQKTVGGNTNYVKRRPAVITGFATDTNPIMRVRHIGETYGNGTTGVVRQIDWPVSAISPSRTVGSAARAGKYIGGLG
jgi:hypothetical protein